MKETKRNTKERHRGTEPFRNAGTKYLRERRVCGVGERCTVPVAGRQKWTLHCPAALK
tara:strand:- start:378 stop:551 length:174 start_codon:yes stop_codon:yes gene_type:complete